MQNQLRLEQSKINEVESISPARKSYIRQARLFPKNTVIWIQGILVWMHKDQIAVDDGTGIARIDVCNMKKRDIASNVEALQIGNYIMVVGEMAGKFKGRRMGMKATTVRDITQQGPMMESLWSVEVVDSFLLFVEDRREVAKNSKVN